MRLKTLAIGGALTALSFSAVPLAMANASTAKPLTNSHKPAPNAHKPAANTHKPAKHFTAVGTVVSVDLTAGSVTVADKGGSKDLHAKTVVVLTDAKTKIVRGGAKAALASLVAGDHVAVSGTRTSAGLLAAHVNAAAKVTAPAAPSPSAEPTPSAAPTSPAASS